MKRVRRLFPTLLLVTFTIILGSCTGSSPTEVQYAICDPSNVDCPCPDGCSASISICEPPSPLSLASVDIGNSTGCHPPSDFPMNSIPVLCDTWTNTTITFYVTGNTNCVGGVVTPYDEALYTVKGVDLTPYSDCVTPTFNACPDWGMDKYDACGECS
jgi:hypothetical protein